MKKRQTASEALPFRHHLVLQQSFPWLDPAAVGRTSQRESQLVHSLSSFRGIDGPFLRPPRVSYSDHRLLLLSAQKQRD